MISLIAELTVVCFIGSVFPDYSTEMEFLLIEYIECVNPDGPLFYILCGLSKRSIKMQELSFKFLCHDLPKHYG